MLPWRWEFKALNEVDSVVGRCFLPKYRILTERKDPNRNERQERRRRERWDVAGRNWAADALVGG